MSSPPPSLIPPGTVIPFPLPWGQTGCCPPGGMDALMKCYCDIQAASAFIGQILIDQINNNPAVIEAIIAAIEKSGSNVPLVGVTNGADAQPGQVGEFVSFYALSPYPTGANTQIVAMGTLPPGDWDCWGWSNTTTIMDAVTTYLSVTPPGFSNSMGVFQSFATANDYNTLIMVTVRALTSAPSAITFTAVTDSPTAGNIGIQFYARRRR